MAFGTRKRLVAAVGLSAALGVGSTALAQDQNFDEGALKSFAVAALQVQEIVVSAQQQMQAAPAEDAQQEIRAQAMAQMEQVIEAEGISVEQYNEIVNAAQSDPTLAGQIQQYIEEEQQ